MSSIEDRVTPDTLAERRDAGVGLIGDIGATNGCFALVFPWRQDRDGAGLRAGR